MSPAVSLAVSPAKPFARRLVVPALLAVVPTATLAALVLSSSGAASADYAGPNQPIGTVESVTAASGTVEFTGWVADPNARKTNLVVEGVVDGHVRVQTTTTVARPVIATKYGVGPTAGFVLDVRAPSGNHTVCVVARNVGLGLNRVVKCVFTPLGRTLSGSETARHNPHGAITWANAGSSWFHVNGYAADPDYLARRLTIGVYVDGAWAATVTTDDVAGWTPPAGVNSNARFDTTLRGLAHGAHLVCIRVADVGPGDGVSLGCRAADTRGKGTGTVTPPSVNAKIVGEAKKHIGQDYVWGAEGPNTFDCSGLVIYSYSKYGVSTPRVSEDQFRAARLITADRAVPGDLVFYHDSTGDVYHVGIYLSPGNTVAAIDTSEGVDYQHIWNPGSATYGSFTHS